jgi:hypothetical protein
MPATPFYGASVLGFSSLGVVATLLSFFILRVNLQPQELRCFFKWVSYFA